MSGDIKDGRIYRVAQALIGQVLPESKRCGDLYLGARHYTSCLKGVAP